jgi:hypothetical protein
MDQSTEAVPGQHNKICGTPVAVLDAEALPCLDR